jgi:histidine triad (HIT) family protein
MNCIFCKIINKEIPAKIIYEDDNFLAFLDIEPNTYGHTLVISKNHADNFTSMSSSAVAELIQVVHKIAPQLVEILGADGYNLAINNGRAAGQLVDHAHWHIIPRWVDDNLIHWPHSQIAKEKLAETFTKLEGRIK